MTEKFRIWETNANRCLEHFCRRIAARAFQFHTSIIMIHGLVSQQKWNGWYSNVRKSCVPRLYTHRSWWNTLLMSFLITSLPKWYIILGTIILKKNNNPIETSFATQLNGNAGRIVLNIHVSCVERRRHSGCCIIGYNDSRASNNLPPLYVGVCFPIYQRARQMIAFLSSVSLVFPGVYCAPNIKLIWIRFLLRLCHEGIFPTVSAQLPSLYFCRFWHHRLRIIGD